MTILHHKVNQGYGGAIKTGIYNSDTAYAVTIDADGQHSLEDLDKLYNFAIQEDADLVVGNRRGSKDASAYRALGKQVIRTFANILMPIPIQDLNSGLKLFRTELAKKYIKICPDTMSFSDVITLVFIKKRNLVLEHEITIKQRLAGKSTINTYTAIETIIEILNIAVLFNPLRIFIPIAILCILFGLGWGITILALVGRGVSVGAMLAIVTGLIFFVLGLLANQISSLRLGTTARLSCENHSSIIQWKCYKSPLQALPDGSLSNAKLFSYGQWTGARIPLRIRQQAWIPDVKR